MFNCEITMPNVTISVPEGLKTEMDALSEVNWSEICRNAISRYIAERKNPTPQFQLRADEIDPESHHESGYPGLRVTLSIQNQMGFEIVVDRILYNVSFFTTRGQWDSAGSDVDLYRRSVPANAMGGAQFFLRMLKEKIIHLDQFLNETFRCRVECIMFVDGFRYPYKGHAYFKIPIDEWKKFVDRVKPEKASKKDIAIAI